VALGAVAVLAVGSAPAAVTGHGKTLRLIAIQNQQEFLDLGAAGPSLGDQLVFSNTLYRRGHEVGTDGAVCTITAIAAPYGTPTFECLSTVRLRDGQITGQGLNEFQGEGDPGPFFIVITGGTGAYRGASGEAVVRNVSATKAVYTLHFDGHSKHKH
jgi:hypothetical protein